MTREIEYPHILGFKKGSAVRFHLGTQDASQFSVRVSIAISTFFFAMPPKVTENSPAIKRLVQKLRSGEITDAHSPSQVWKCEALFQLYKMATFRTRLHHLRKEDSMQQDRKFFETMFAF